MADVDSMIEQLFPGQSARPALPDALKTQSSFDMDTPERNPQPKAGARSAEELAQASAAATSVPLLNSNVLARTTSSAQSTTGAPAKSSFDEESSDEEHSSGAGASNGKLHHVHHHFQVPFPTHSSSAHLCGACLHRCVVSSESNRALHHPTLTELRNFDGVTIHTPIPMIMKRKGAFHAYLDHNVGNGGGPEACINMSCRRCDHPVVRLHGVRWRDNAGKRDLYLSLRYYYPDWHRLAMVENADGSDGPILEADPNAAAYACQCSWLTVRGTHIITTTSVDISTYAQLCAQQGPEHIHRALFLTELPAASSDTVASASGPPRRPPLWECRGHGVIG